MTDRFGSDEVKVPLRRSTPGIDIALMVPCYSDDENVTAALEDIRNAVACLTITYEMIVIDHCLSDRTSDKVREYQLQHPEMSIYLHRNEVNCGHAKTFVDGALISSFNYNPTDRQTDAPSADVAR